MARAATGAVALGGLVMLASGFSFSSVTGTQSAPLGPVKLDAKICRQGAVGCAPGASPAGTGQLMVAVRASEGAPSPQTVTIQGSGLDLNRRDDYANALQSVLPAPAGQRWVGYMSDPTNLAAVAAGGPQTLPMEFGLPPGPDGRAFAGPFEYRVVVGARAATDATTAGRAVLCAANPSQVADDTICVAGPDLGTVAASATVATRDAGARATSGPARAVGGALVNVPFAVDYAGAAPGAPLTITAGSAIPGATVTPDTTAVDFGGTGERAVSVSVEVPPSTPPGTYDTELVVAFDGRERRARGQVEITPTPPGIGLLTLTSASAKTSWRRSAARGRVTFKGSSPNGAVMNVQLRRKGAANSRGRVPKVTRSAFVQTSVGGGAFSRSIRIAPGLLPGRYDLQVSPVSFGGVALPKSTRAVSLKAPNEGVARSAYVSLSRSGKAISRVTGRRKTIYGRFQFAPGALPKRSKKLTVAWYRNGKQVAKPVVKKRRSTVTTFLRNRSGRLPKGTYRAVLKWGPKTVALGSVRIG